MDEELLGIGAFSLLSGLTVAALRHYDEAGLLEPARTDATTRYRYYRRAQLPQAHAIRALRAVDVPLPEVAALLGTSGEPEWRAALLRHRTRLTGRAEELAEQLTMLDELIEKGVAMPTKAGNRLVMINIPADDLESSRGFYEALLGVEFAFEQHAGGPPHLNATFGEWNTPSWFLLALRPGTGDGSADVGFLVDDLDGAYRAALDSGGTDVHPPRELDGMPRHAQVRDPAGNHVGLYEG